MLQRREGVIKQKLGGVALNTLVLMSALHNHNIIPEDHIFVNDTANLIGFSKADVSTICKSHIQSHAVSQQDIFNDGKYPKEDTTEEESDVM